MSSRTKRAEAAAPARSGRLYVMVPLDELQHVRSQMKGLGPMAISGEQLRRLQSASDMIAGWQARPRRLLPLSSEGRTS